MSVSFNQIPHNIRTPGQYLEFDGTRAVQGFTAIPHKILVIGQRLAAGAVAEAVPTLILSGDQAEEAFGRGSMLAEMFKALKAANRRTESWGVALDEDAGGVAATGKLTAGGTATAPGTIALYIAGKRITAAVAVGDDGDAVAAALIAAINAETDLPVSALVDGEDANEVNLTCRWKGVTGNLIDVRLNYYQGERLPAGVTLAITAMANGTTDPDIADALTAIGDVRYQTIITPYTGAANLTALETELANRWGPMMMSDGQAFAAAKGSVGTLQALGDGRNSPHVSILDAGLGITPVWVWAAVVGAVDAAEPDPARPRQTLALPGLLADPEPSRRTRDERELLLFDGIATHTVDSGGVVRIERLITTYQENPLGIADPTYLDVETLRTLSFIREQRRARVALKWPRHKLAANGTLASPGQAVVTPNDIRLDGIAQFREFEAAGLVEGFDQFIEDFIVERDEDDPSRVNEVFPPDLINQFRVFASLIQFRV